MIISPFIRSVSLIILITTASTVSCAEQQPKKTPSTTVTIASTIIASALYGTGMYYYPKHGAFITLVAVAGGAFIQARHCFNRDIFTNKAHWPAKETALSYFMNCSIMVGLAAGYGLSMYAKGVRS